MGEKLKCPYCRALIMRKLIPGYPGRWFHSVPMCDQWKITEANLRPSLMALKDLVENPMQPNRGHDIDRMYEEGTMPIIRKQSVRPPTCYACSDICEWMCIVCGKGLCLNHRFTQLDMSQRKDPLCSESCWVMAGSPED